MENVLVCGYGCHLTESLKGYLDFVANYLLSSKGTNLVITSGGYTNQKTAPGVCEANLVRNYLWNAGINQATTCERDGVMSMDNLWLAKFILTDRFFDHMPLRIFCDSIRKFKIAYLAKRMFECPVQVVGYNFGRSIKERVAQRLFLTPVEVAAFYIPALERKLRMYRFKQNQAR